MIIKNIPHIMGIDIVRIYRKNQVLAEEWIGYAELALYFEANIALKPFANQSIDYIEICVEGDICKNVVCEIYLK